MKKLQRQGRIGVWIALAAVVLAGTGPSFATGMALVDGGIGDGGILDGCKGAGVPVVVPHQVSIIGVANTGLADPQNDDGDSGLFVFDRSEDNDWFYMMVGESQAGTCTNALLGEIDRMVCAAQEPVSVWQEWAADVETRSQEIQTYGQPILPCTEPAE